MVSAFTYNTTNEALAHKLGRGRPRTTADLLDIATKFVDGEDALGQFSASEKACAMLASPTTRKGSVGNTPTCTEGTTILGTMKRKSPPLIGHPDHQ